MISKQEAISATASGEKKHKTQGWHSPAQP